MLSVLHSFASFHTTAGLVLPAVATLAAVFAFPVSANSFPCLYSLYIYQVQAEATFSTPHGEDLPMLEKGGFLSYLHAFIIVEI